MLKVFVHSLCGNYQSHWGNWEEERNRVFALRGWSEIRHHLVLATGVCSTLLTELQGSGPYARAALDPKSHQVPANRRKGSMGASGRCCLPAAAVHTVSLPLWETAHQPWTLTFPRSYFALFAKSLWISAFYQQVLLPHIKVASVLNEHRFPKSTRSGCCCRCLEFLDKRSLLVRLATLKSNQNNVSSQKPTKGN